MPDPANPQPTAAETNAVFTADCGCTWGYDYHGDRCPEHGKIGRHVPCDTFTRAQIVAWLRSEAALTQMREGLREAIERGRLPGDIENRLRGLLALSPPADTAAGAKPEGKE